MQEKEFDVLAPVDNKNLLSRAFWIIGSIVSMVLLAVSFCVESAVLLVLFNFCIFPRHISLIKDNEVFQIEYGNGALGIPWRRIVGDR